MKSFFEIRIYKVKPGKMNEWVSFMEKTIIPFQVSKGMVIHGSFIENSKDIFLLEENKRVMKTNKNTNSYIWIRRFENEEQKKKLYQKVYESDIWLNDIGPKVAGLIDRNSIIVHNVVSTELSSMK